MTIEHTIGAPEPAEVLRQAATVLHCYAERGKQTVTGYQAWAKLLHPGVVGDLLVAWITTAVTEADQIGPNPQALAFARAILAREADIR